MDVSDDQDLRARIGLHGCVALLALREEGARATFLGSNRMCRAWAAACLAELAFADAIRLDGNGRVQPSAVCPPALDESSSSVWAAISSSGHPRRLNAWIPKISEMVSERRMLLPVVSAGLVVDERGRYALPDGMQRIEGKTSLREDLRDAVLGDPRRDVCMRALSILAALRGSGCLKLAFTKDERPYARQRIACLIAGGAASGRGEGRAEIIAALASGY